MHVEVLALLGLFAANGLLAMSEIALVSARRSRLQALVERGDGCAAAALRLHEDPTRFLSTVQVGITGVGILSGIVGEAALAVPLATVLVSAGLEPRAASAAATAVVVVVVTYFAIVPGELVPKWVGQSAPEAVARRVARPVTWLLDGLMPTSELKVRLGLDGLPAEGQGRYNTLAGMLMLLLGRVPRTGDVAAWGGWRLEVVDMDANRVDKVLAVPQTPGEEPRRA